MADAIADLLAIMRDDMHVMPRDRLNAAISASRVERLQLPGEEPPESVRYLRNVVDNSKIAANLRREAAAALAYFQKRSEKAAVALELPDLDEQRRRWRSIINAGLRLALERRGQRQRHDVLLHAADNFELPAADPEAVMSAMLRGSDRKLVRLVARAVEKRLAQFDLSPIQ